MWLQDSELTAKVGSMLLPIPLSQQKHFAKFAAMQS